jgi:hypothetical protein
VIGVHQREQAAVNVRNPGDVEAAGDLARRGGGFNKTPFCYVIGAEYGGFSSVAAVGERSDLKSVCKEGEKGKSKSKVRRRMRELRDSQQEHVVRESGEGKQKEQSTDGEVAGPTVPPLVSSKTSSDFA